MSFLNTIFKIGRVAFFVLAVVTVTGQAQSVDNWRGISIPIPSYGAIAQATGQLGGGWYYDWTMTTAWMADSKYVPMLRPRNGQTLAQIEAAAAIEPRNRYWLVFNEPDISGQDKDLLPTAQAAALKYAEYYNAVKRGSGGLATLVVGGTAYQTTTVTGRKWWDTFHTSVTVPVEAIHIHGYAFENFTGNRKCDEIRSQFDFKFLASCLGTSLQSTYSYLQTKPKFQGKKIWISETACLGAGWFDPANIGNNFMLPYLTWFRTARNGSYPLFQRLGWFSLYIPAGQDGYYDSNLVDAAGVLTPVGQAWLTFTP